MDENAKLSHIRPQQNNDQTVSTDSSTHDIFLVLEDEYNEDRLRIVHLNSEIGEMTSVGEIPYLKWPCVVVCASSIFCLAGFDLSGPVHQYDLITRTTRTPNQMSETVRWSACAASDHEVIVSGGKNSSWKSVATCGVYAPATNRWTSLRPLRRARESHQMCWLPDGRVFAIGGDCDQEHLSSVEMLERAWIPAAREEALVEWTNVAPMKTKRNGFGCCILEGRIVVAGGRTVGDNPSLSVESFEPPTPTSIGQWTSLTNLLSNMYSCFLVPSAAGLLLIHRGGGKMQLGRRKAQAASSSEWTWEPRLGLTSTEFCRGVVSLPSTAGASQR